MSHANRHSADSGGRGLRRSGQLGAHEEFCPIVSGRTLRSAWRALVMDGNLACRRSRILLIKLCIRRFYGLIVRHVLPAFFRPQENGLHIQI